MQRVTRLYLCLSSMLVAAALLCSACGSSSGTSANSSGNGTTTPVAVPSVLPAISPSPAASGNSISGSVALLDRNAKAPITVALYAAQSNGQPKAVQTVDTQGAYNFPGLADGTYRLLIVSSGYRSQTDVLAVSNQRALVKNYMLSATNGSLNGAEIAGMMNQHQNITHLLTSLHGFPVTALQLNQFNLKHNLTANPSSKQARKGTLGAVHPYTVPGATSIAVDASNNVWVSANVQPGSPSNGVVQLDSKGNVLQSGPTDPNSNSSGGGPIGVDASLNVAIGNLSKTTSILGGGKLSNLSVVNNISNNQGALFPSAIKPQPTSSSRFVATFPLAATPLQFLTPTGYSAASAKFPAGLTVTGRCLAVDPKDNSIYVGGTVLTPPPAPFAQSATLLHLDASGSTVLETIPLGSTAAAANFNPQGLVLNSRGTLFLGATAQSLPGLVMVSGAVGSRTVTPITTSHQDGTVFRPTALALDAQDNLWTCDSQGGIVTRFDSAAANPTDVSVGQFPIDLATDAAGNAWVTLQSQTNPGQVVEIDGQPAVVNTSTQLSDGSTQTINGGTPANQNTSTVIHTIPSSNVGSVANFGPTTIPSSGPPFINFVGQNPFGGTMQAGSMSFPPAGGVTFQMGALPGAYDPTTAPPPSTTTVLTSPPVITSQTTPVIVSQTAPVPVSQTAPVIVTSTTKVDGSQTFDVNLQGTYFHLAGAFGPYQSDGSQTVDLLLTDVLEAQYPDSAMRYHITGTYNQKGEAALEIEVTGGRLPNGSPNPGLSFTSIITTGSDNKYHETILNTLGNNGAQESTSSSGGGFEQVFLHTFLGDLSTFNLPLYNFQAPIGAGASGFQIVSSGGSCGPGYNPLQLGSPVPVSTFNPITNQVETISTANICTTGFHQVGGDGGAGSGPTVVDNGDSFGYSGAAPDPGGYGGGGIPGL